MKTALSEFTILHTHVLYPRIHVVSLRPLHSRQLVCDTYARNAAY